MRRKSGILLIELLVHLALLAIVTSFGISYYRFAKDRFFLKIVERELPAMKLALNFYAQHQKPKEAYPPSTDYICADYLMLDKPPAISQILPDPFSKLEFEYHYAVSPNGRYYCLWSIGKNGKSQITGIDDEGNVLKGKKCDDIYIMDSLKN